jgi:hypothetical protein
LSRNVRQSRCREQEMGLWKQVQPDQAGRGAVPADDPHRSRRGTGHVQNARDVLASTDDRKDRRVCAGVLDAGDPSLDDCHGSSVPCGQIFEGSGDCKQRGCLSKRNRMQSHGTGSACSRPPPLEVS